MTDEADVDVQFLTEGGQAADATRDRLFAFVAAAERSLDIAVYDAHFVDDTGDRLIKLLDDAEARGVRVRAVYNDVHRRPVPIPPPPEGPSLLQRLATAVPSNAIPGIPDLMHHKYVVRDGETVWTGSTNWSSDAWTRMENLIVTIESADLGAAYTRDFEQLWSKRHVDHTGTFDDEPTTLPRGAKVRVLFSPGRGRKMSQLVATRIGQARTRIRICSPVITSSPILGTLAEVLDDGSCDALITIDGPQMAQALSQWRRDGRAAWKAPIYERVVRSGRVAAKPSTPWSPDAVHDYMHAKLVVCDDWVLTGSYNCSHSGEMNAENLLDIHDAALADRCATFCEQVHARYAASGAPVGSP
ncbi:MAG TPA: phospholipase D-like domain-containing protein [Acidimicrobiales bacterium]|nr:phospholipase D-like domain-containing protein [Acidimicrobiales bacterium]